MNKITEIQYWTHTDPATERKSFWGDVVIDDIFIIQFHCNDNEECLYSIPTGRENYWIGEEAQDAAYETYEIKEVVKFIKQQGFEETIEYLERNADLY